MKWPSFDYIRPRDLDALWQAQRTHGEALQVMAGGQTLLATLAFRLSQPGVLADITRIPEFQGISVHDGALRIGAATTHAVLGRDALVRQHAPLLHAAAPLIAHPAIRNRGTIGGSLAYADPAAELPACVVALDATMVLVSAAGERRVPAGEFFTGVMQTALRPGELILAVEVPALAASQRSGIQEIARRSGDYAMAGLAASLHLGTGGQVAAARLVFFGLGSAPAPARQAQAVLEGRPLDAAGIAAAQAALSQDLDPTGDLHGPPALKHHLARVLLARVLGPMVPSQEIAA